MAPHKDAIVVTFIITDIRVYRILIDNGSSTNILFKYTLNRMDLVEAKFEPVKSPLYGLIGNNVYSEWVLTLPVEFEAHPCQHIQSVDLVVVDCL